MSQPTLSRKRRRSSAFTSSSFAEHSSPASINPLSHPPHVLKQFLTAGLSPEQPLPATYVPYFPHRGLPDPAAEQPSGSRASGSGSDDDSALLDPKAHLSSSDDAGGPGAPRLFSSADADGGHSAGAATTDDQADGAGAEAGYGDEDAARVARARRAAAKRDRAHDRVVGALVVIVRRCLAAGDARRARRAFAALVRSRVEHGQRVDLRRDGYWALGLEVLRLEGRLMMQGGGPGNAEQQQQEEEEGMVGGQGWERGDGNLGDEADERDAKDTTGEQWLRAAPPTNLDQVLAYFRALILQFPYNRQFPEALSALDFYPAMFGYELISIYAVHRTGLERAKRESEAPWAEGEEDVDNDGMGGTMRTDLDEEEGDGYGKGGKIHTSPREARLRREKDRLRMQVVERLTDIAKRMDELMENPPYRTDYEHLRLRGMVALYLADASLPSAPRSSTRDDDGPGSRKARMEEARRFFRRIEENGDELEDAWVKDFMRSSDDDDDDDDGEGNRKDIVMYSSLPMR